MVLVGRAIPIPGSPVGDIYVSQALLAQLGEAKVREMVRRQYRAGHEADARRRAYVKRKP